MKKAKKLVSLVLVLTILAGLCNLASYFTQASGTTEGIYLYTEVDNYIHCYQPNASGTWREINWGVPLYRNTSNDYAAYCVQHYVDGVGSSVNHSRTDMSAILTSQQKYGVQYILSWGFPANYTSGTLEGYSLDATEAEVATAVAIQLYLSYMNASYANDSDGWRPYDHMVAVAGHENVYNAAYALCSKAINGVQMVHEIAIAQTGGPVESDDKQSYIYSYKVSVNNCNLGWDAVVNGVDYASINQTGSDTFTVTVPKTENYGKTMEVVANGYDNRTGSNFFGYVPNGTNTQDMVLVDCNIKSRADLGRVTASIPQQYTASINLNKTSDLTGEALPGVTFGLYEYSVASNSYNLVGNLTDNGNGTYSYPDTIKYTTSNLGKFKISEDAPAPDYVKQDWSSDIVLSAVNQNLTYNVTNTPTQGVIKLTKYGEQPVGYEAEETEFGTVYKLVYDKVGLQNVEFTIYDTNENIVGTMTTDANGNAMSTALPIGVYTVRETATPSGFVPAEDVQVTVAYSEDLETPIYDITTDINNNAVSTSVNIYKEGQTVTENSDGTYNFDGTTPLSGVTFGIYSASALCNAQGTQILGADTLVGVIQTDENGIANLSDKLVNGTYYFKELQAPFGYEIDTEEHEFTISLGNDTEQVIDVNKDNPLVNTLVKRSGIVKVIKTGERATGYEEMETQYGTVKRLTFSEGTIEGVGFTIYDSEGNEVETIETGEDGLAYSSELEYGHYSIAETYTPDGLVTSEPYEFDVTYELGSDYTYEITDNVFNKAVSSEIDIYKVGEALNIDSTDKGSYDFDKRIPLEGVYFGVFANEDIYNAAGDEVLIAKDEMIGLVKTNSEGVASLVECLLPGDYYYQEVATLRGYELDETKYEFNVQLGNEEVEKIEVNKENPNVNYLIKHTEVKICKFDKGSQEVLPGVEFELYNENNELMGTFVTGEDGYIYIYDLPYGNYYFKETKALDHYILDDRKIAFTIDEESQVDLMLKAFNQKYTYALLGLEDLPVAARVMIMCGFIGIISIAGYFVLSSRKRRISIQINKKDNK